MSTLEEAAAVVAGCGHSQVERESDEERGVEIQRWRCIVCSVEFVRAVAHLPLRAEIAGLKLDFAKDQAELASMRITVAEAKADLATAAKVTEELVDGLSEETRKRQVAEVELAKSRATEDQWGRDAANYKLHAEASAEIAKMWERRWRESEAERARLQAEVERLGGAPF